jgi:uncharacterized protein YaeQ
MALSALLYRIQIELSHVDRGLYETLDFRVARHPSEDAARLVARVLAYALYYEEGLEFGRGLSNADEPALARRDLTGQLTHWIDVGVPSAERIHGASKRAPRVTIVCHKDLGALRRELGTTHVHRAEEVEVLALEPAFVEALAAELDRNAAWTVVAFDGSLSVTTPSGTRDGRLEALRLDNLG